MLEDLRYSLPFLMKNRGFTPTAVAGVGSRREYGLFSLVAIRYGRSILGKTIDLDEQRYVIVG